MSFRHLIMQAESRKAYYALMPHYPLTTNDIEGEIWRDSVEGYKISNFGRLKKIYKTAERIRKPTILHCYLVFVIFKNGTTKCYSAHRLVAQAFVPNSERKPFVNHIDGNKFNNHFSNLEWVTQSENVQHAYSTGLIPSGASHPDAKLTNEQVNWYRKVYVPHDLKYGASALARKLGASSRTILRAIHGQSYKSADGAIRPARSMRVPNEIRAEIQRLYIKGSHEFGSSGLAKKFALDKATVLRIVRQTNQ